MTALVGFSGFVGSNIHEAAGDEIKLLYNSRNIENAYGTRPNLLIYSGLRAEKYLANNEPDKDRELVDEAWKNIQRIGPRKLVLISTIDVFKKPVGVDENSEVDTKDLHPYGANRYELECKVTDLYPETLIIRLPGLFGKNIKKNFIYDFINVIPFMITKERMEEIAEKDTKIKEYYEIWDNGFYKVLPLPADQRAELKQRFKMVGFSALNFTDTRSNFQFYNLGNLWKDIKTCLENDIRLWHPATEPVNAGELYHYLTGQDFVNELGGVPANYDYKSIHYKLFGGENGYIATKEKIMEEIKGFVNR